MLCIWIRSFSNIVPLVIEPTLLLLSAHVECIQLRRMYLLSTSANLGIQIIANASSNFIVHLAFATTFNIIRLLERPFVLPIRMPVHTEIRRDVPTALRVLHRPLDLMLIQKPHSLLFPAFSTSVSFRLVSILEILLKIGKHVILLFSPRLRFLLPSFRFCSRVEPFILRIGVVAVDVDCVAADLLASAADDIGV